MTDRELLELAAKAAGIKIIRITDTGMPLIIGKNEDGKYWDSWNPLTDDGDRYRLVRTCKMRIDFQEGLVFAGYEIAFRFTPGNDKEEAYAIVRAAAEIGRNMK